jgi:hypothetical protein
MSKEFEKKLKDYTEGKLSDDERAEIEKEMEKMELYQAHLEKVMNDANTPIHDKKGQDEPPKIRKEKVIIRKGKWKARITNTWTVLSVLLLITIVSSFMTSLFFGIGEPNRMDTYRDVVSSTIAVTRPNVDVNLSSNVHTFFSIDVNGKMKKKIGSSYESIGEFSMPFLLGKPGNHTISWLDDRMADTIHFYEPKTKRSEVEDSEEWNILEKLPEGTVAEVFLSFEQLFTTDELLKKFEHQNMEPVWFAADVGIEADSGDDPVGFPSTPIWHHDDWIVDSYTEEKTGFFGKVITKTSSTPSVDPNGDGKLREENFLQTLKLMQTYRSITKQIAPSFKIDEAIDYLETNGVKLYGAVVTGPTKELLKLQEEPWVKTVRVGEVRLWNWDDETEP